MNATLTDGVRESVRGFLASNFYLPDPSKLADDTSLVESGIVDSTGILEVLSYIEQAFGIRVEDSEAIPANLDSVNNIIAFVGRKRQPSVVAA